jgi:hypothetical protein
MFKVEISDGYNGLEDEIELDTLEAALDTVKDAVIRGKSVEDITIWQEIQVDITVSVAVKAE